MNRKRESSRRRCAVPEHLRQQIMTESHSSPMAGHFSGEKLYKSLVRHWWWPGMYKDVILFCKSCVMVNSTGRVNPSPHTCRETFSDIWRRYNGFAYHQIGKQTCGCVPAKWPLVYPVRDQKAITIAKLLVEEVIPVSDRGTNLLSHLMMDLCKMMGIRKINTTAYHPKYHPKCDGMVERFNSLKMVLRKHAAVCSIWRTMGHLSLWSTVRL